MIQLNYEKINKTLHVPIEKRSKCKYYAHKSLQY